MFEMPRMDAKTSRIETVAGGDEDPRETLLKKKGVKGLKILFDNTTDSDQLVEIGRLAANFFPNGPESSWVVACFAKALELTEDPVKRKALVRVMIDTSHITYLVSSFHAAIVKDFRSRIKKDPHNLLILEDLSDFTARWVLKESIEPKALPYLEDRINNALDLATQEKRALSTILPTGGYRTNAKAGADIGVDDERIDARIADLVGLKESISEYKEIPENYAEFEEVADSDFENLKSKYSFFSSHSSYHYDPQSFEDVEKLYLTAIHKAERLTSKIPSVLERIRGMEKKLQSVRDLKKRKKPLFYKASD